VRRGQNAGHGHVSAKLSGEIAHLVNELVCGPLHFLETVAPILERIHVELNVELCELRDDAIVGVELQHVLDDGRGLTALVHHEEFLLRPNPSHSGFKHVLPKHLLQGANILNQVIRKLPQDRRVRVPVYVVLTHESVRVVKKEWLETRQGARGTERALSAPPARKGLVDANIIKLL
jgi:hypothetical protein